MFDLSFDLSKTAIIIIGIVVVLLILLVIGIVLILVLGRQNGSPNGTQNANAAGMPNMSMNGFRDRPDEINRTEPLDDLDATQRLFPIPEPKDADQKNGFSIEYEIAFTGSTEIIE